MRERVLSMTLEDQRVDVARFLDRLTEGAGIVEERVSGEELRSPSVQIRVTLLGEIELLSTHDQILGGRTGQSYLGCRFPADRARGSDRVRGAPSERCWPSGASSAGSRSTSSSRSDGRWTSDAIEINLRRGGTTHPFLTLQFLTDGQYDADSSRFLTLTGDERHLVATDHFADESLKGLRLADFLRPGRRLGDALRPGPRAGVVFHMMSETPGGWSA